MRTGISSAHRAVGQGHAVRVNDRECGGCAGGQQGDDVATDLDIRPER